MADNFQNLLKALQTQERFAKSTDMARAILGRDFTAGLSKVQGAEAIARTLTSKMYNPFLANNSFNRIFDASFAADAIARPNPALARVIKSQFYLGQLFTKNPFFSDLPFSSVSFPSVTQVYKAITDKASKMAEVTKNEEELEAIAEVADQTSDFAAVVEQKNVLTKEDFIIYQERLFKFLIDNVVPKKWLKTSHANWSQFIYFIMSVLIAFLMWRYPHEDGKQSTPQEIQQVQKDSLQRVEQFVSKDKISKKVNKNFNLRAEPVFSSQRLYFIKKDSIVLVLNSTNTWALVTYMSADGYPANGWIPKSLLSSK